MAQVEISSPFPTVPTKVLAMSLIGSLCFMCHVCDLDQLWRPRTWNKLVSLNCILTSSFISRLCPVHCLLTSSHNSRFSSYTTFLILRNDKRSQAGAGPTSSFLGDNLASSSNPVCSKPNLPSSIEHMLPHVSLEAITVCDRPCGLAHPDSIYNHLHAFSSLYDETYES